jgi:hypothetical protein
MKKFSIQKRVTNHNVQDIDVTDIELYEKSRGGLRVADTLRYDKVTTHTGSNPVLLTTRITCLKINNKVFTSAACN